MVRLYVCLVVVVASLIALPNVASAEGRSGGVGEAPSVAPLDASELLPLLGAPLAPSGVASLIGEPVREAEEVRRVSPEAIVARETSSTKYENLNEEQAEKIAVEVFPSLIDQAADEPPVLSTGQDIAGYPTDDVAQVDLGEGRRGVIESTVPMAVKTSAGQRVPVDLGLSETEGAFEPRTPAVGVKIGKQLSSGVSLTDSGVSLEPVDGQGNSLGGSEGAADGAVVFYANAQTDLDMVAKPIALGFEIDALLRSAESPQQLFFRVGMPEGASLVRVKGSPGAVQVVDAGVAMATVLAPSAEDATGTSVPIAMSVSGDILTLSVDERAGEYEYPIAVDPTVIDETVGWTGAWRSYTPYSDLHYESANGSYSFDSGESFVDGQWGEIFYETQGKSQIYKAWLKTAERNEGYFHAKLRMQSAKGVEGPEVEVPFEGPYGETEHELCGAGGCAGGKLEAGREANGLYFEQEADQTATPAGGPLYDALTKAKVYIEQEAGPSSPVFNTTEEVVSGKQNVLYGSRWVSAKAGTWGFKATATDPGLGVKSAIWSSPSAAKWGSTSSLSCTGVQCQESVAPTYTLQGEGGESLPDGEDTIELKVENSVGLTAKTQSAKFKVDSTPPHGITLSGLPSTHEIDDGQHFLLEASATDGETGTPSSGIASIRLTMDGQEVGSRSKGCSLGPCTATGTWTLGGESYAAGQYTLDVIATDNAGNVATQEFQVTVHHAPSVAVGPGSVNPVTGELGLSATDVAIGVPNGSLTVSRGYRSRHLALGTEGPLGPQWILSLGAQQSLSRTPSGGVVLTGSGGEQTVFASNGKGGFTSPTGDAGLTLVEKKVGAATDFVLSENGAATTFALPVGSGGSVWTPSISEGAGGTNAATYTYRLESGVIEPTEELAPVPTGVSCAPTLTKGCRALKFEYASKETKAPGESPSEWNEFAGHLSKVTYTVWNPSTKEMASKVVAQYAYDKHGRLRAEWNPQIESLLKTIYGYDTEEHVTAVSAPGEQPTLFEQGTVPGDGGTGRLMAVDRPTNTTATELKEEMSEPTPVNTGAPTLSSTTPKVGVKISVSSNGAWNSNPLAYSYQWQDCNSSGTECTAIQGAVNQAYYPVSADEGHTLVAQVVALNATGSATKSSAATSKVAAGTPNTPLPEPPSVGSSSVVTFEYQVPLSGTGVPQMTAGEVAKWGQTDAPAEAMAVFPPDKPMGWPAKEYTRATINYLDDKDRAVNTYGPTGGISTSEYNQYNDVVRTLSPDNRAVALTAGEKSSEVSKELDSENTYEEKGSEPGTELLSTLGAQHTIELANGTQAEAREHTVYSYNEGVPKEGGPYHLVTKLREGAQIAGKEESEVRTTNTSYSGQNNLGWKLRKPSTVTTDPSGLKLTHSTFYEPKTGSVTESRTPGAGAPGEEQGYSFAQQFGKAGSESGQFKEPQGIAVNSSGDEYVLDTGNSRIEEFNSKGTLIRTIGKSGAGAGNFKEPRGIAIDASGNIWVADTGNNRVQEFSATGGWLDKFGSSSTLKEPQGVAVDSEGNVWVTDTGNNRMVEYYTLKEEEPEEEKTYYVRKTFGTSGSGEEQFKEPQDLAFGAEGNLYVIDTGNNRIDEYNAAAKHIRNFGKEGTGAGQLKTPHGIATDSAGDVWVADAGNNRIDEFGATGTYIQTFGKEGTTEGKLKGPKGVAIDTEGDPWVADTANSNVQEWTPNGSGYGTGTATAHNTQTIYYTAGANSKLTACGEHPEWANLPCQTQPAAQPEGSLPKLQSTSYTYNMWDEPEIVTNTSGTTTRTTTQTYDAAGRLKTTAISSTVGTALPAATDAYNSETGALEKQSTTTEGKTKTITSAYNTLGELSSYTDAGEATSTYEYDVDRRIVKSNDGKGTETYTYSKTTGLPIELLNEYGPSKLLFTAAYDAEGDMLSETYPNGMSASYTYDATGKPVGLEYKKTTHCTEEKEKCKWFTDSVTPSIHGQWLSQTSTLSKQAYTYDAAGRLTTVQNTPSGKECTTRIYAYEADSNRTSLTTDEPNIKGECATESGTTEKHTYDTADRLTDSGTSYNTWGDITALPAADAGGKEPSEELTSSYYVDSQLATQTQAGETIGYNLDPVGRTIETIAAGKKVADTSLHYAGPGDTPAWSENTSGETTRNIPSLNGELAAVQYNTETPVLQLTNLHGDIVATAYLSETATELASKVDVSEFGVPTTNLPPKYSWLGAIELPTELPSGIIAMGARSYIPQLGRFLQPDPRSGGSANAYGYTFGDPVNSTDPTGESTVPSEWSLATSIENANATAAPWLAEQAAKRAAEEAAARELAERAARAAAYEAEQAAGPQWGEDEELWELEEYEEGEYEYASYQGEATNGEEEARAEPAVLFRPLAGEAGAEATQGGTGELGATQLCEKQRMTVDAESQPAPCARDAFLGIHIHLGHVIHVAKHFWNTVGSDIETGAKEAWKASGGSAKAMWEFGKGAYEDWTDSGLPPP